MSQLNNDFIVELHDLCTKFQRRTLTNGARKLLEKNEPEMVEFLNNQMREAIVALQQVNEILADAHTAWIDQPK